MFIHIGNNVLISDRKCIGIFNIETLKMSDDNKWMLNNVSKNDKMISFDSDNKITASEISSYTVIKRLTMKADEIFWSK